VRFERFCRIVRQECRKVPRALLDGLEGGVHCERTSSRDPEDPEIFQLAHYEPGCVFGPRVVLHHGSFEKMDFEDEREYRREIRITVRHELRHHWEDKAGLPDLRDEDAHWLMKHKPADEKPLPRWLPAAFAVFVVVGVGLAVALVAPGGPLVRALAGGIAAAVAAVALRPKKRRKKKKKKPRALPPAPARGGRFLRSHRRGLPRAPRPPR
jgi:hypothetical protein